MNDQPNLGGQPFPSERTISWEPQERSETQPDRILRLRSVIGRTGFSKTTIYRKVAEGTFPRQIQISTRCSGWRESAIDRWMTDPLRYREAE